MTSAPPISPALAAQLRAAHEQERRDADADDLTPAELRVLRLVATGHTNKAAGAALGVSEDTVKTHLKGIYRKLDVDDRAHAVHEAHLRGLLP